MMLPLGVLQHQRYPLVTLDSVGVVLKLIVRTGIITIACQVKKSFKVPGLFPLDVEKIWEMDSLWELCSLVEKKQLLEMNLVLRDIALEQPLDAKIVRKHLEPILTAHKHDAMLQSLQPGIFLKGSASPLFQFACAHSARMHACACAHMCACECAHAHTRTHALWAHQACCR